MKETDEMDNRKKVWYILCAVVILISVLISAAVLFAMFLLYNGVSDGIDTSEQRMGADIVVVPGEAEELLDETDLLFTGAPFSAVKTICIVLSIPFLFVILGMLIGLFRWLKSDSAERQKTGE